MPQLRFKAKMIHIVYLQMIDLLFSAYGFLRLLLLSVAIFSLSLPAHAQELFDLSQRTSEVSEQAYAVSRQRLQVRRFPTLTMLAQYRGEQKRGVIYLSEKEREAYKVYFCGQKLCDLQGVPLNSGVLPPLVRPTEFPEIKEGKDLRRLGLAIYVMDERGELWVSFKAKPKFFHHSSFLAGGPVAAAGEMLIYNGVLVGINNLSGHYQPPPVVIDRVILTLKQGGVPTTGLLIKHFGSNF